MKLPRAAQADRLRMIGNIPFALSLSKGFLRQAQDDRKYKVSPNGDW